MQFKNYELPIAQSMVAAARRVKPRRDGRHPYDKYFLLWTAFNNIYSEIAAREGYRTELVRGEDGAVETWLNGNVKIPKVKSIHEREQIYLAVTKFDGKLKDRLILHECTQFFVKRTPFWQGKPIEYDTFGQRVNGVIHVAHTTCVEYPVWSPVDHQIYEGYLDHLEDAEARDFLTRQILDLLYIVRENLMHFSRKFDDSNDIAVIDHALPLLDLIVGAMFRG